ncbi:MAG TPA: phosphoenolpyruvate--protein phosphotransferase, partial [Anaerolineales bacterium]
QMASPELPLAIAAGVGPERQEIGTDAVEISEAIQAVDSGDGVLVLMDLGSAILSAEMALELLPPEFAGRVKFCAAPIVEGAIAAGVQAGLGSDLETVCREAQQALLPKIEHLGGPMVEVKTAQPPAAGGQEIRLTLQNEHGLHARPAARFVQTAASFDSEVLVRDQTNGKGPVSGRSLNGLASLGAVRGHEVAVSASGRQASEALKALKALVEANFGEKPGAEMITPAQAAAALQGEPAEPGTIQAIPISEGIALGPLYKFQPPPPPIPSGPIDNPSQAWEQLERAVAMAEATIRQRRQQLRASLGEEQTAIFDAHLLILEDPDLLAQARKDIYENHQNPAAAWHAAISRVADIYLSLEDPYQRQRAMDVVDVGNQVLFALSGKQNPTQIELSEPVILYAQEITPTETSQLDMAKVLGIVTTGGGPTSHSAILARGLGIPAVSGAPAALGSLPSGSRLALDGSRGLIWTDPSGAVEADLVTRREKWLAGRQRLLQTSRALAATGDGRRVEVVANVGNLLDARAADSNGAEGIGLLRTEFLFLTRTSAPTEDEQTEALQQIGEVMGERPVIVRTLDAGGDKELPYLELPAEANPFLGVRALRLTLRNPGLFQAQLRAILRAGTGRRFRIMFPMVANLDEVAEARRSLEQAHQSLLQEARPHAWPVETGIMIEIPAAAVLSEVFAPVVDFFSIGTNDLTQYTLAAERGNPALAGYADALHPAVLRLIAGVTEAAHRHGKWVGVCGELAGDPAATAVLVGLDVDELSLNSAGIPRIKAALRQLKYPDAQKLAQQALKTENAAAARSLAQTFYRDRLAKELDL